MLRSLALKILSLIPVLVGASVIAFVLIRLVPGDPVTNLLGERGGDPAVVEELRNKLGLDRPILEQYFFFVGNALKGDLGNSIVSKLPVAGEFWSRFPATFELSLVAIIWSTLLGIPLGVLAAVKKNTWLDFSVMGTALVGYSMPIFWWGLMLIILFSVKLGMFPVSGRIGIEYDLVSKTGFYLVDSWFSSDSIPAILSSLKHLFLPAFVLGTIPLAVIARMTRSSLLETFSEDFIRTAKAKGVSPQGVLWRHALRTALVPIVTVLGLLFGSLLTGAILTETIFSWPGIGRWLVKSVEARDYPVIQGGILLISVMIVFVNLLIDMAYQWVDPRMRGRS